MVTLIKQCKIPYKNLDKTLLFSRNQVFCLKNWKLWRAPTTLEYDNFCWYFPHVSDLPMCSKGCSRFVFIWFRFSVICQNKKTLVSAHSQKPDLSITQDLNKIKKSWILFCIHWQVGKVCKISIKNIKSVIVGARQNIQLFKQMTWFLGNNRLFLDLSSGFWIT